MAKPFYSGTVLPPRLPVLQNDLTGMPASWMDRSSSLDSSNLDCRKDILAIDALRRDIAKSLGEWLKSKDDDDDDEPNDKITIAIDMMHKYYHYLSEWEEHEMVQQLSSDVGCAAFTWESALKVNTCCKIQTSNSLGFERANVIWNLTTFEALKASKQETGTKPGWLEASKYLQNAASWLGHLLALLQELEKSQQQYQHQQSHPQYSYSDMSPTFIRFWQALLLAQAQQCCYESLSFGNRQMQHAMAAKVATAAVPLYNEVELIFQKDKILTKPFLSQCSNLVQTWVRFSRTWGVYMSCKAQYHQSQKDRKGQLWGQELARLRIADEMFCSNLCTSDHTAMRELKFTLENQLKQASLKKNNEGYNRTIPEGCDLRKIQGEQLVKSEHPLSRLLGTKETKQIFQEKTISPSNGCSSLYSNGNGNSNSNDNDNDNGNGNGNGNGNDNGNDNGNVRKTSNTKETNQPPTPSSSSSSSTPCSTQMKKAVPSGVAAPNIQTYVEVFKSEMNEIINQIGKENDAQTESARLALDEVNLPHSLIVYRQEQAGGGLPINIWKRVDTIQTEDQIVQLTRDLWELKDAAGLARSKDQSIKSQLDSDQHSDKIFREANPDFLGHDLREVQKGFRQRLKNFDTLLVTAQKGDDTLFQRLNKLDIEPKFKLLKFSKSRLDLLFPSARVNTDSSTVFDTRHLSNLLGKLSFLCEERDVILKMIDKKLEKFDILGALEMKIDHATATDRDYLEATKFEQQYFDGPRCKIQNNMKRQKELLNVILIENEAFVNSREITTNFRTAVLSIGIIEDAIEEIDQLSRHLKEGKNFYNVVIPMMDDLNREVGDTSAKLTANRLDYEDKANRTRQELKDARMAKNLSFDEGSSSDAAANVGPAASDAQGPSSSNANTNTNTNTNELPQPNQQSFAASTSGAQITSNIDDEQVARLVTMGFDVAKVAAALEKHNNDFHDSFNELCSNQDE